MSDTPNTIPPLGFGTYGRRGAAGIDAIVTALEVGYRHLDTAQDYGTEREVGEAIGRFGLDRREVFVTTKVATENFASGKLAGSVEESLRQTGLDQLDLTLIHWPSPNGEIEPHVYLEQLGEIQERGLTRLIGVSNFTIALLEIARAVLGEGRIATNQIELNPLMQNKKVAAYCDKRGIVVTCYQPIAKGALADNATLVEIGNSHDASPEQIALAFELAKGYCAIPTSSKADRIRSNYEALNIALTPEEIARIETLDQNRRAIDPDWGDLIGTEVAAVYSKGCIRWHPCIGPRATLAC